MKHCLLRRRFALVLCALPMAVLPLSFAQAQVRPGRPIDLDRELRPELPQDRSKSYYHYCLSKWYDDKGDSGRALSEMRRALDYNKDSTLVRLELAGLLEKSGNVSGALAEAEEAARLDPRNPEPHWLLSNIYFRFQGRDRNAAAESLKKAVGELEIMRELAPEDERAHYALGGAYMEMGEAEKAILAFEKFQSLVNDTDAGYVAIAEYYDRQGVPEKVIQYLKKAIESQPDDVKAVMMLANKYSLLKRDSEAIPLYKKALQLAGPNPAITKQMATALVDAGEFAEAVEALEGLQKDRPAELDVQVLLGRALIGSREFTRAAEVLEKVTKIKPDYLEALFYLGVVQEQNGNPAQAATIFSQLLDMTKGLAREQKENRTVFQEHLAAAYQDLGEHDKAVSVYEEMIKDDANPDARRVFLLINAYRLNRQYDEAAVLGKRQYEQDPKDINIGLVYARTLGDAGRTDEGSRILLEMLRANPENIDIYVNLSQIYLQGKRYSEAEKILRRAEDQKLNSERVKFQLATVYERQKNFDRAESLFKEVLKENPKNAVVLNYIGYMLADRGVRLQEAVRYVEEALAIDPENGAYLDSLGWAFFKLNDLEKAEKHLLKAVELVKNDPVILDHLGDLYFKFGDYQKAEDYWTRSLSQGTEEEDNRKISEKLDELRKSLRRQNRR